MCLYMGCSFYDETVILFLMLVVGDICSLSDIPYMSQEPNLMDFPTCCSYYIISDYMSKFKKQIIHSV